MPDQPPQDKVDNGISGPPAAPQLFDISGPSPQLLLNEFDIPQIIPSRQFRRELVTRQKIMNSEQLFIDLSFSDFESHSNPNKVSLSSYNQRLEKLHTSMNQDVKKYIPTYMANFQRNKESVLDPSN